MGILEGFKGYAVHDCWASYFRFAILHVLCGAHFLRELIHAHEQHQQSWAEKLITCLLNANKETEEARTKGASMLDESRINHYDRRYSRILRQGRAELPVMPISTTKKRGRAKQHKAKNLHDRLFRYKVETLAFLYDLTLPFDNNFTEHDVRMIKAKLKISGCFRSEQGADIFCRTCGYISSAKKQGRKVLNSLRKSIQGQAFNPAIVSVG
ncbi:IS66 family transposase [Granulosicoccus antarcticus]|nr:transposase [Granulosicoccus antarcticus]